MDNIIQSIYESSTQSYVYGMGTTTTNDILDFTEYALEDIISKNDLDVIITEVALDTTAVNDNPHKNADLRMIVYYVGDVKENEFDDILHSEQYIKTLTYNKVYIDIKTQKDK